ncbi:MAG: deoxyguanosinetriphosphate triphosphohydrolase [Piscinibacter sp.]|uniref:deoxyguanosinetriphosphate triphosphohydrolase n=1 Tax=Piscinibacter sp. TaxID=1903157 RepID=UPI00258E6E26|nr:deoxyguanosinetriphosphate triphosphohydrolase [Piscinibacter sp.]MCW5667085.1 deoxyguanosinetriphosphate triphosphohydrolase [Piscinibacter sp.]
MDPFAAGLRACASDPSRSRGRRHAEPPAPGRNDFQRDRDRIVHSTAFRRLVYKTQVFLNHEGDLFRTRLTHSLEVAQLARAIARRLGLHEDLCEAIALAHDLGHTPFGHAGQDALDACLREAAPGSGGFEHNLQSLRVVDALEQRYAGFDGLNLSFETREGILKHCSRRHAAELERIEPGGVGRRFIDGTRPGLEAQVCNLADEIAYNTHDVDDGVRAGLLQVEQLLGLPLFARHHAQALQEHPGLAGRRLLYETLRRMLSAQVHDLVACSDQLLQRHDPADADAARRAPPLIAFSEPCAGELGELKRFLRRALYRHPRVVATTDGGRRVIRELFHAYLAEPGRMPDEHARREPRPEAVADYIAGMTDRFALREHARLYGPAFSAALQRQLDTD